MPQLLNVIDISKVSENNEGQMAQREDLHREEGITEGELKQAFG